MIFFTVTLQYRDWFSKILLVAGKALRDRKRLSVESGEEDGGVPMSLHLLAEWADPTQETHLIVYFGEWFMPPFLLRLWVWCLSATDKCVCFLSFCDVCMLWCVTSCFTLFCFLIDELNLTHLHIT